MSGYEAAHQRILTLAASLSAVRAGALLRKIAAGLKRRQRQRIAAQQNPDGSAYAPRKPRLRRGRRIADGAALFRALRNQISVQAGGSRASLSIGNRIAAVHQFGLVDEVEPGGPLYQYPARQLLGLSDDDLAWIQDQLDKLVAP